MASVAPSELTAVMAFYTGHQSISPPSDRTLRYVHNGGVYLYTECRRKNEKHYSSSEGERKAEGENEVACRCYIVMPRRRQNIKK